MKTVFIAAAFLLAFSCKNDKVKISQATFPKDSLASKKDSGQPKNAAGPIEEIKNEYSRLQQQLEAKKFISAQLTYNCNEEPSGEITFYSDKGEIRVIEHFYTEHSHFSASEKYFIKNGLPFFIFKEETVWSFDGGTPEKPITKDDITETRIYLQNGETLKCLEKKYSIRSDNKAKTSPDIIPSKETQCNTDELLETFQSLLRKKDKKGEIKCL